METQCALCEVGSDLQYNTGVTSVENSTEGIMVIEWRYVYTEAVERCSMDGGDGGAQAFLSQPILYWTPATFGLCQQYLSACS
jgi:lipoate synthase